MLKIPEQAVRCFEQWSKTHVMIYDFCREFLPVMPLMRNIHRHSICDIAKTVDSAKQCTGFDYWLVQREVWRYRDGFLKHCHCDVLEWCIPIYSGNKLLCILEAGLRRPLPGVIYPLPMIREPVVRTIADTEVIFADIHEVELVMEGLRQLAARLQIWYEMLHREILEHAEVPRHIQIHALLLRNYRSKTSLSAIAKLLHLSPSRAAHVIKEVTGKTFKELLQEYRLRNACLQLQTTNLSVSEIAQDAGFADTANFYRVFKQHLKMTPCQYRTTKQNEQLRLYEA